MHTDQSDADRDLRPEQALAGPGASFVVDVAAAQVIAANRAGRAMWGVDPRADAVCVCLDHSMPALGTLRAIAADGSDAATATTPLEFWHMGRLIRGRFHLRRLSSGAVEIAEQCPPTAEAQAAAATKTGNAHAASAPSAPKPRRGDLETLREIARRIRCARPRERDAEIVASRPPTPRLLVADEPEPMRGERPRPDAAEPAPSAPDAPAPGAAPTRMEPRAVLERIVAEAEGLQAAADESGGALSHELRTQIGAILSAARTALEHAQIRPSRPPVFTEIDLGALFEASAERAAKALEERGLRLATSHGRRIPHVVTDRAALTALCEAMLEAPVLMPPPDGTASLAVRHAIDGPVVLAVSFRPPAGAVSRFEPRLSALRSLARSIGCALASETSATGLMNLRLEIPKSRLIPI